MDKTVIKFYKVVQFHNYVRWAYYTSACCKFPIVYMCQKLWHLVGNIQSYCNNKRDVSHGPQWIKMHVKRRNELHQHVNYHRKSCYVWRLQNWRSETKSCCSPTHNMLQR